jgi:hypothetical protein
MIALVSITLALLGLGAPPAGMPADPPELSPSLDAQAFGDCLDCFLLLEDPSVDTQFVDFVDCGAVTLVTAVHTIELATASMSYSWAVVYSFPSSIFAHSLVKVPMRAEEMD